MQDRYMEETAKSRGFSGREKVLNLKMKNGLNFEIPVNGMTEDVEQFRLLIGKE